MELLTPTSRNRTGRFAPSPTGDLHLGNLATALLAQVASRAAGARFLLRIDDLDPERSRAAFVDSQMADLAAIGIRWDERPVVQSERRSAHDAAVERLAADGMLYECWCTRAEVLEAASAPHGDHPDGAYPGTCRSLTFDEQAERRAGGRTSCLRLNAMNQMIGFDDEVLGRTSAVVDDFVVVRKDGVPAYNLAVVVDDDAAGIGLVVRGADLASGTPRQLLLQRLLGLAHPAYAHVPLVLDASGARLSKRSGAVTVHALRAAGESDNDIRGRVIELAGLGNRDELLGDDDLIERFRERGFPTGNIVWQS